MDSWAHYWSDLTNLERFEDLTEADVKHWLRRRLRLFTRSSMPALPPGDNRRAKDVKLGAFLSISAEDAPDPASLPAPVYRALIAQQRAAHEVAKRVIRPLLTGHNVAAPQLPENNRTLVKLASDGVIRVAEAKQYAAFMDVQALVDMLRPGAIFPIRSCPNCGRAFTREGRQKYCSTTCTTTSLEVARRGSQERKEQLAEAQRRYREKRRGAAAAKRTPTARRTKGGK